MTVYVIQRDRTKDFSDAKNYGELKYILGRSFFPDTAALDVEVARQMLNSQLSNFNPREDFILLNGDPAATLLVAGILARDKRGPVKFLKWDRETRSYYIVEIDLG